MSDQHDKEPRSLEEQLRDMLKNTNLSFAMPGVNAEAQTKKDTSQAEKASQDNVDALRPIREFKRSPREIRDYLDRFVIRQDEAKKVLSVAVCDHYNHVRRCIDRPESDDEEYLKHNVLLLGPTGVGKTYLMRCVARLIGVPFVKADASKFSETGYVGRDVDDLVRDLVKAADGNTELAQYGIIYLDEVDKIASHSGSTKDVSGRGVQTTLLKLMEETDVSLFSQTDILGQMQAMMDMQRGGGSPQRTISTRHILFIMSGAFDTLPDLIQKRLKSGTIGFGSSATTGPIEESEYLHAVQTQDLITYGFEPEFVGRLPVRVVCDPLSVDDLEQIMLCSEGSILRQYEKDFEGYGLQLTVQPEAVREVAERAQIEKTGARGLMTVLERALRDFKFELPSSGVQKVTVERRTVEAPSEALKALLEEQVDARQSVLVEELLGLTQAFEQQTGIALKFNSDASKWLTNQCLEKHQTMSRFWSEHFHDLEYGFALMARNTGKKTYRLTGKFVKDPENELSKMVASSFKESKSQQ